VAGSSLLTQAFVRGYRMRDDGPVKPGSFAALQSAFRWFCEPDPAPVQVFTLFSTENLFCSNSKQFLVLHPLAESVLLAATSRSRASSFNIWRRTCLLLARPTLLAEQVINLRKLLMCLSDQGARS